MRISTNQINDQAVGAMLDTQTKAARTQLQLATGRKILTPADDPAAGASILGLKQAIAVNAQYQKNADTARARLHREESALTGVENLLQRVRELAIQGNNDSQNSQTRRAIASEVRERLSELLAIANTVDANGEYLFAGYQRHTQPFAADPAGGYNYFGDQGQRFLEIGPDRQMADGDPGADVFQLIGNGNGTFTTQEDSANNGSGVIDPGRVSDPTAYDGDTYTVLFPFETAATGTLAFNDNNANDTLAYTLSIDGTAVYTVDETGAPVNTLAGLAAEINDDAGVTGVRAYVANSRLYLTRTAPSTSPITVTESVSGYTAGDGDQVTGYFGTVLDADTDPSVDIVYMPADATAYLVLDSSANVEAAGAYAEDAVVSFNGVQTSFKGAPLHGDRFTIAPNTNQDLFATVENLATALETGAGDTAGRARFHNAINRFLTDLDQAQTNIEDVHARIGGRLNAIDSQVDGNELATLQLRETLSTVEDLDYAEAISRLNLQLLALQAAQQSFVRIQGLSLFNFLG